MADPPFPTAPLTTVTQPESANRRGFIAILAAQFLSALADNALLFAAIAALAARAAPGWHTPLLQEFFVVSYVVLAPFVGPIADAFPKSRVMFFANAVKFVGCISLWLGLQPLYAFGIVGIGASIYSPAKYGILTEYLPPSRLVVANSWMEGSTVAAIILGAVLGGGLLVPSFAAWASRVFDFQPALTPPEFAASVIALLYLAAAVVNLAMPFVPIDHRLPKKNPAYLLHDFWHAFRLLWRDPQGQVSLAVTTLFWGVGATMRLVVLAWAGVALGLDLEEATQLTAMVAVGIAAGAAAAGRWVKLEDAVRVLPAGVVMGLLILAMLLVHDWRVALFALFAVGALGGFFLVPLNALLQHRGHLLMGAGHSVAIQNFNENAGILVLLGAYTLMEAAGWPVGAVITAFGLFVTLSMGAVYYQHGWKPARRRAAEARL